MNCLIGSQLTWNVKPYFLWKTSTTKIKMLSSAVVISTLRVNAEGYIIYLNGCYTNHPMWKRVFWTYANSKDSDNCTATQFVIKVYVFFLKDIFEKCQWFCKLTLIKLCWHAGWYGPLMSGMPQRYLFTWHDTYRNGVKPFGTADSKNSVDDGLVFYVPFNII